MPRTRPRPCSSMNLALLSRRFSNAGSPSADPKSLLNKAHGATLRGLSLLPRQSQCEFQCLCLDPHATFELRIVHFAQHPLEGWTRIEPCGGQIIAGHQRRGGEVGLLQNRKLVEQPIDALTPNSQG